MKMQRREWSVAHGRDGFVLLVYDRWIVGLIAEWIVEKLLAILGHPCCGRGIGRIPGIDHAAFVLLNAPNQLRRHDTRVARLPLTVEQAFTFQPSLRHDSLITVNGTDDSGDTWADAVMVGALDDDEDD